MEINRFSLSLLRRSPTSAKAERRPLTFRRKITPAIKRTNYAMLCHSGLSGIFLFFRKDCRRPGIKCGVAAMTVVPVFNCRSNKAGAFLTSLGVLSIFFMLCAFGDPADAQDKTFKRTVETYTVPDVTLVNQNGARVRIRSLLQSDKPVVVDFIFGTCTTICPVLSAGLASLQQQLGPDARKVQLVSISIDPENDTPKVMKDYLKRYGAKPGWDFLTGTRTDIDKVLYALSAYIQNKMDHYPLTLIRSSGDGKWVRVRGLMSGAQLMTEVRQAGLK